MVPVQRTEIWDSGIANFQSGLTQDANYLPSKLAGPAIKIRLRQSSSGQVTYLLDRWRYTIGPGEAQTLACDVPWTIRYHDGVGRTLTHQLEAGTYEFLPSSGAWRLFRTSESGH